MSEDRNEMLKRVREKMAERSKNRRDPDEFRPPKAKEDEVLAFYFRVLPGLGKNETCRTGLSDTEMDLFSYENGCHFHNNERFECPRVHGTGDECPMCSLGFELMTDSTDKDYRRQVAKTWLSRSYYAVNIYFTNEERNPESLRGKVMWYNMPKQIFDKMEACVSNDDPGTADEKKAYGIFYHPNECYIFKLVVKKQGEFNTYEESCFLPASLSPLVKKEDGTPDTEAIEAILAQRMELPKKFKAVDLPKLTALRDIMLKKEGGDSPSGSTEVHEDIEEIDGVTKGVPEKTKEKAKEEPKAEEKAKEEPPKAEAKEEPKAEEKAKEPPKAEAKEEPKAEEKAATGDADDPELANLLGAIRSKKK